MLTVTDPPTAAIITLEALKARLRVDHDDDDSDLELLLAAATEAYERATSTVLRVTGYELRLAGFARTIALPAWPLRSVDAVTWIDADGAEQTVPSDQYTVVKTPEGADVAFVSSWSAPALAADQPEPVRVAFTAGFDDPGATDGTLPLPKAAILAVAMLAGHWYANRETVTIGQAAAKVPMAFDWLAAKARIYR